MNEKVKAPSLESWKKFHAALVFLLFCFFMLRRFAPLRWGYLYAFYGSTAVMAAIVLYFFFVRFHNRFEINLVAFYAIWLILSRILQHDFYLVHEPNVLISRFTCLMMVSVGPMLESREREKFLKALCTVVGLYYTVIAAIAIAVHLLGIQLVIPPEAVFGWADYNFTDIYLNALNTYRNTSAVWFMFSFFYMTYLFFACKHKLLRIPITLCALVLYCAVAMTFCRSVMLPFTGGIAMLAMLLAMRRLPHKALWQKALIVLLFALVFIPLTYKSYDWNSSLMTALSSRLQTGIAASEVQGSLPPASDATSQEPVSGADVPAEPDQAYQSKEENASSGTVVYDGRDIIKDAETFTGRTIIWKALIPTFKQEPIRLLYGNYLDKMMLLPNSFTGVDFFWDSMHNNFLEILVFAGIPGFLLACAFFVLLILRMIHYFFSDDPRATLARKMLILPIVCCLFHSLMEAGFFTPYGTGGDLASTEMRELFFFMTSGLFLGCSYDVLPALSLRKKKQNQPVVDTKD